jgi:hypothetical protein
MERSTTGLTVRFFSVNIANCHGRTDNSTGNILPTIGRERPRHSRDELTGDKKLGSKRHREGLQNDFRHGEATGPEGLCNACVIRGTGRSKNPALANEFGEIDLPTTSPSGSRASHRDQMVIEQGFHHHLACRKIT